MRTAIAKRKKYNGFITDEEAEIIYKLAVEHTPEMGLMVGFGLFRGWRIEEIRTANVHDFMNSNYNEIEQIVCKSNIKDKFPLVSGFSELIKEYIKNNDFRLKNGWLFPGKHGGHMTKEAANWTFYKFRWKLIKKYPQLADGTDYSTGYFKHRASWHSLRRWFVTMLKRSGYSDDQIADILRWKDKKMVRRYWNSYQTWCNESKILDEVFGSYFAKFNNKAIGQTTLGEFGV